MTPDPEHLTKAIGPVADAAVSLVRLIHAGTGQISYYSEAGELGFGFEAGSAGSLIIVVNWKGSRRLQIRQPASPDLPRVVEPSDDGMPWAKDVTRMLSDLKHFQEAKQIRSKREPR